MNRKQSNTQRGFTLIELIIVITIVGILAAVALPHFIAAASDARAAKANAIFGSVRTAAALARARCELDLAAGLVGVGTCGNAAPQVNMDGTLVTIVNRFPAASATGITAAASINPTSDGLLISGTGPITYTINGANNPATCAISYTAATVNAAPGIAVDTSGC